MANQKVSHLRAKLENGSIGQTFDVYDEQALHQTINNLTTSITGNPLDAAQGPAIISRIASVSSSVSAETSRATSAENTLSARMDTFASLPSGSTSGNAELVDIRVKADGTTASSAGNAVREQITDVNNDITAAKSVIISNNTINGSFEHNFFNSDAEVPILKTTGYPTNSSPGISQFYHEIELEKNEYITRIEYNTSVINACNIDIMFLIAKENSHFAIAKNTISASTGNVSITLNVNKYLSANYKYYIYVRASVNNALKWTGNGLQSEAVSVIGSYWDTRASVKISLSGNISTNIGFLGNIYSLGSAPSLQDEITTGGIACGNKIIADTNYIKSFPTGISINNGVITQQHTGSGNRWWEIPFNATKAHNNIIKFSFNVTSISGTGRVYLFAYNTSGVLQYISLGFISTVGAKSYDIDFNYYAVYNNIDLSRKASVGISNFTEDYNAVYTNVAVIEPLLSSIAEDTPLNTVLENLSAEISTISGSGTEDSVVSPNGTKYYISVSNSGLLQAKPVTPTGKVLLIGNSLLFGFQTFGMCASDSEHDYYWNIRKTLLQLSPDISITRIMGTPFEECTTTEAAGTWMTNTLESVLSNDYTLAIIQLGDNVNNAQRLAVFRDNAISLINYIKSRCENVRIAWAGEWYYSTQKQDIIKEACNKTGSVFIDISQLVTDENKGKIGNVIHRASSSSVTYSVSSYSDDSTNRIITIIFTVDGKSYQSAVPYESYTVSDNSVTITGFYTVVTSQGVASHPGNKGMLAIANKMLYTLGITSSMDEII